jgi:hypothetical protein
MKTIILKRGMIPLMLILGIFSPDCRVQAQSRGVDWIHGLGGDAESWAEVAHYYQAQRPIVNPTRYSFPTGNGIPFMASDIQGRTGGNDRIAICHSLGGVAARQVDLWNQNQWKGVVTMGSPLRGAQLVNSVNNGAVQAFINNGIIQLMKGPEAGTSVAIVLPGLGILIHEIGVWGTTYSNTIAGLLTSSITNTIGLTPATSSDLSSESPYIQQVSGASTPTPKIIVWGNESDPLLWRTAGSFAGGTDQEGVDNANKAVNVYTTLADVEYALRFINPIFWGFHDRRGDAWADGRDWLNYDSNTGWRQVIGALYTETITGEVWENACSEEYYYYYCDQQSDPELCRSYCTRMHYQIWHIYHDLPSDGIVTKESQINAGGNWRGEVREAPGVNHREFRTVRNIDDTMTWILDGNYRDDIFRIHY